MAGALPAFLLFSLFDNRCRWGSSNTLKKDIAQTSKEHFRIDLTVMSQLLFVEHADLHHSKSMSFNEHHHVYFMNTHRDCLTTWLVFKKYSVLDFPCRSAKKVQNWIWGELLILSSILYLWIQKWQVHPGRTCSLIVASLLCCSALFPEYSFCSENNHVLFTIVIQQQHRTIMSGTQSFLNLL